MRKRPAEWCRGGARRNVDVGQIKEMLRLTPTQRLRKAWRYGRLIREIQHAARLCASDS